MQTRERLEDVSRRTSVCYKPLGIESTEKRNELPHDFKIESGMRNVDLVSQSRGS